MNRALRRRGAEAIEFALVMPVFLAIALGMIDLAWMFYTQSSLDVSTHIGCRAGALIDPGLREANLTEVQETTMAALVAAMAQQGLPECDGRCSGAFDTFGQVPSRALTCEVAYQFDPLIGFGLTSLTLRSTQVVRMEWQRG